MGWEKLLESLDELETRETYDGYFCSVKDAVVIVILGSLSGLKNVKQIHEWATTEHIRTFLEKEFCIKRIPCYWWLLSLIALVTPASLNLCMKNWVSRIAPGLSEKIESDEESKKEIQLTVAIDGKEIRSTEKMDKYDNPLHIVSAQIGELGLTLAQEAVDGKSNEIPTVQKLIKSLELKGCIIVADALNCQIDTAQAALDKQADYLLSVKDNQLSLKEDIEDYITDEKLRSKMDTFTTKDYGHGRIENRTAYTTCNIGWQPGGREWPGLKCIGAIHSHFETKKGSSDEWHYYISSKKLTAKELIHHARKEWSIETMHWLLDVHFMEDGCRIQSRNAKQNMNMLRKFALNIVRIHKTATSSKAALNGIMFQCLMNPSKLCMILHEN